MLLTNAEITAKRIIINAGLDDIQYLREFDLKELVQSRGAYYEEISLNKKDGRIVSHLGKSIITINSNIIDLGKKRFTVAHELGHFELHKNLIATADTQFELCNWYQSGSHEKEANEFASELLMPSGLYHNSCKGQKFNHQLLLFLSNTFRVSRTAAILKFLRAGNHPILIVCCQDNKVKWWKMSKKMEDEEHDTIPGWLKYKVRPATNLPPPPDSVIGQLFKKTRGSTDIDRTQEVEKSTWFYTKPDDDPKMFEFCHFVPTYNFALSVVWAD